jgi:hypothetical protein
MADVRELIAQMFQGRQSLTATDINQRVATAPVSADVVQRFALFPEGDYTEEEAAYTFDELFDRTPEIAAAGDADAHARTGADQPWEAEDVAVAEGRDPTRRNVDRARQELAEDGPAVIERIVP